MAQQIIQLNIDLPAPVEEIFSFFEVHENLGRIFGARISRIREGSDAPNGTGSVRKLSIGPLPPIEETVTLYEKNARIEYSISNTTPLKNHHGIMRFSEKDGGTHLDYNIVFESRIPLVGGLIRKTLERNIRKGCEKYARSLA